MRYFIPDIRLAAELPAQISVEDKLGGLPWGLPQPLWPVCKDCGKSQSLLAQFAHDPNRLNLGKDGRVLFVFQCNHDPGMCSTWEGGSGANACFVLEQEELIQALSTCPLDNPPLEREVRIVRWLERDDGVDPSDASKYFSEEKRMAMTEDEWRKPTTGTRVGGVPAWIQSADEAPEGDWRFVGQLDSTYSFFTPPLSGDVPVDERSWEGRTHVIEGPNFGDGGIAYLFLRDGEAKPEGWFFWQCG